MFDTFLVPNLTTHTQQVVNLAHTMAIEEGLCAF